MKKVMLIIVGMLMSLSVSAANLDLTGGFQIYGNDNSAQNIVGVSGDDWVAEFGVKTLVDSTISAVTVENTDFDLLVSSVVLYAGLDVVAEAVSDGSGTWTLWAALTGLTEYTLKIFGSGEGSVTATVVSAVPIPAALFLFAPALLGFFGLRRKAAVAA